LIVKTRKTDKQVFEKPSKAHPQIIDEIKEALNPNFLNLTINREKFCL